MAFTFRGTANLLNKITKNENRNGFHQFSAPGPHQGEGGQNVTLDEAVRSFDKRQNSPLKRDTTLEHAEWHFSKREAGTPAKKCMPITQKSSPLKMNDALVSGAADVARKFVDVGAEVKKAFTDNTPEAKTADLGKTAIDNKKEDKPAK